MAEPCQRTSPLAARVNPQSVRSSVVLPLPLTPVTCSNSPAFKRNERWLNSGRSPRTHSRSTTSSKAGLPKQTLILLVKINTRSLREVRRGCRECPPDTRARSEEHTSELKPHVNL